MANKFEKKVKANLIVARIFAILFSVLLIAGSVIVGLMLMNGTLMKKEMPITGIIVIAAGSLVAIFNLVVVLTIAAAVSASAKVGAPSVAYAAPATAAQPEVQPAVQASAAAEKAQTPEKTQIHAPAAQPAAQQAAVDARAEFLASVDTKGVAKEDIEAAKKLFTSGVMDEAGYEAYIKSKRKSSKS